MDWFTLPFFLNVTAVLFLSTRNLSKVNVVRFDGVPLFDSIKLTKVYYYRILQAKAYEFTDGIARVPNLTSFKDYVVSRQRGSRPSIYSS